MLKWASDISGCAANTLTEVTEAGADVTGTQPYSLVGVQPGGNEVFDPYLNVNFATPVNKFMYLKGAGSTKFNLGAGQSHTFKVLLRVCGYETISP